MTSRSSPLSARYSSLSKSSLLRKYVKSVPSATPATWAIRAVGALTPSSAITCVAAARRALRLSSLLGRAMSDHSLIISPAAARKGRGKARPLRGPHLRGLQQPACRRRHCAYRPHVRYEEGIMTRNPRGAAIVLGGAVAKGAFAAGALAHVTEKLQG